MSDLLWLLLPVAALSGYWTAKWQQRVDPHPDPRSRSQADSASGAADPPLSPGYIKGMNYLLNEQPDRALRAFTQALEVNAETVETHLALGGLFRRRGEVERAIRIHQNLIARPTLDRDRRALAVLELARDYHKAGLLDRAEGLFEEVAAMRDYAPLALPHLVQIHQQAREWDKAIAACLRLEQAGIARATEIGHFHCEMAEEALRAGRVAAGRRALDAAGEVDPGALRPWILRARMAQQSGAQDEALQCCLEIERRDARFLPLVTEVLTEVLGQENSAEAAVLQARLLSSAREPTLLVALSRVTETQQGVPAALAAALNWLERTPTPAALARVIELASQAPDAQTPVVRQAIAAGAQQIGRTGGTFRCHECGFQGRLMHWQCPGCKQWQTVLPVEEGER